MNRQTLEDKLRIEIYFDNLKREALRQLVTNRNSTINIKENPHGSTRVIEITRSVLDLARNHLDNFIISEVKEADSSTLNTEIIEL